MAGAPIQYYMYRSVWVFTFIVSSTGLLCLPFLFLAGWIPPGLAEPVLLVLIILIGVGAAGMGLEVMQELDETNGCGSESEYRYDVADLD